MKQILLCLSFFLAHALAAEDSAPEKILIGSMTQLAPYQLKLFPQDTKYSAQIQKVDGSPLTTFSECALQESNDFYLVCQNGEEKLEIIQLDTVYTAIWIANDYTEIFATDNFESLTEIFFDQVSPYNMEIFATISSTALPEYSVKITVDGQDFIMVIDEFVSCSGAHTADPKEQPFSLECAHESEEGASSVKIMSENIDGSLILSAVWLNPKQDKKPVLFQSTIDASR